MTHRPMLIATFIVLGRWLRLSDFIFLISYPSRAGRFGTKGLAITFVSSDADQEVLDQIQARFEVKVIDLPDHIDSSSYS